MKLLRLKSTCLRNLIISQLHFWNAHKLMRKESEKGIGKWTRLLLWKENYIVVYVIETFTQDIYSGAMISGNRSGYEIRTRFMNQSNKTERIGNISLYSQELRPYNVIPMYESCGCWYFQISHSARQASSNCI